MPNGLTINVRPVAPDSFALECTRDGNPCWHYSLAELVELGAVIYATIAARAQALSKLVDDVAARDGG